MRVVLDTNVLVSALFKRESTSAQILALWRDRKIELLISPETTAELRTVLAYPRVQKRLIYSEKDVQEFLHLLTTAGTVLTPAETIRAVESDPDDDKFVTLAVLGRATFLVSGDRHLLNLGSVHTVSVVTPRTFLTLWEEHEIDEPEN